MSLLPTLSRPTFRRGVLAILCAASGAAACRPQGGAAGSAAGNANQDAAASTPMADSLSLERTACFGSCPMYQVLVDASGRIRFASRNPQDSNAAAIQSSLPADSARALLARAAQLDMAGFPVNIREDRTWCELQATDHPGVTLHIYAAAGAHRFEDYLGCHAAEGSERNRRLEAVRAFELAVDSVLHTERWAKPPRF